jgi:hypothetical protein
VAPAPIAPNEDLTMLMEKMRYINFQIILFFKEDGFL